MQRASPPQSNGINQFEEILVGFTFTSEIASNCLDIPLVMFFFSFVAILLAVQSGGHLLRLALHLSQKILYILMDDFFYKFHSVSFSWQFGL